MLGLLAGLAAVTSSASCSPAARGSDAAIHPLTFIDDYTLAGPPPLLSATPTAIAFDEEGRSLVTDITGGRVLVFSTDGECLSSWQISPTAVGFPTGIAVHSGDVYITDRERGDVFVFGTTGRPLFSFSERADGIVHIEEPAGITFDSEGRAYVTDIARGVVAVFDADGRFLFEFGESDDRFDGLDGPNGIDVDDEGRVHVVEFPSPVVSVFDGDSGAFLFSYGDTARENGAEAFYGVAIDSDGFAHVTESAASVIVVYDPEGNYVYSYGGRDDDRRRVLMLPRGIAIDPTGRVHVADSAPLTNATQSDPVRTLGRIAVFASTTVDSERPLKSHQTANCGPDAS